MWSPLELEPKEGRMSRTISKALQGAPRTGGGRCVLALLCVTLIVCDAGRTLGIGGWWRSLDAVKNQPLLQ